jgi:glutathione S-transferase
MALHIKGVEYRSIDALALCEHDRLHDVNPRAEVPVLVDDGLTVTDSADIVYHLEDRFPTPALLPTGHELRARARRWQRIADTTLDAIIHDISLWIWPTHNRTDEPPRGLIEEGRSELTRLLAKLEETIGASGFVCEQLSIADLSLFPHISSLRVIGVPLEEASNPKLVNWNRQMRMNSAVQENLLHVKEAAIQKFGPGLSPYEAQKVVWRGDRIEWLLAHGFQDWLFSEISSGRAIFPRSV